MGIVARIRLSIKEIGVLGTLFKILSYPFVVISRGLRQRTLSALPSSEARFTWIYRKNYWQSDESVSGTGSTLEYTANLRKKLPELFRKHSIKSVFDAPCGDFNWMCELIRTLDIEYTGADIVEPLIDSLNSRHGGQGKKFLHMDIVTSRLPKADLMICRDCLFHLSYADTRAVLENFVSSGTPYILTTTHKNDGTFTNHDIQTGFYRRINLFAPPYALPLAPLARIDDWIAPDPEREMCLWSRDQIAEALQVFSR
jgi:hypothetical protein